MNGVEMSIQNVRNATIILQRYYATATSSATIGLRLITTNANIRMTLTADKHGPA